MKKDILASLFGHILLLVIVLFVAGQTQTKRPYPTIHQVSLVSLPKIAPKVEDTKTEAVKQAEIKPQKTPQAKILPTKKSVKKETPPQPKEEAKEEKPAQEQTIEGLGSAVLEGNLESPYYASIVFSKIKSLWRNPVSGAPLQTTIKFVIQRTGEISESQIETPSSNDLFDESALRAVVSAGPLPPLPDYYTGEELVVHLNFIGVP